MRFSKLKSLTLILALSVMQPALAEEAAPAEGTAAPMPKNEKEFLDKTAKLNTLTGRIVESEKRFNEIVHHKNETKDTAEKQKYIQEMLEVSKQRNKDVEEYNKVKMDLTLRYPSQGERLSRRYQTQSKRSVEELEGVAGLDELLTRTKKMVEKKFAPFADKETKDDKKAARAAPADEAPKRLKLEK